jgi:hypothetical protein
MLLQLGAVKGGEMFDSINLGAVLISWVVAFISGFLWFGPKTFFPTWWRLMGKSSTDLPGGGANMGLTFGSVLIGQLVAIVTLALIMSPLIEVGRVSSAIDGALVGLLLGFGIASATALGHRMFAGHGAAVWLIESGNDIINLGIAGAILVALR